MRSRFVVRCVAVLLALAMAFGAAGCFGKFQLTRKLYEINTSIDEKYTRSLVNFLLVIPYFFSSVLDLTVFNVIEFWNGQNPIASAGPTTIFASDGSKVSLSLSRDGMATVAVLDHFGADGRLLATLTVRDDGNGTTASTLVEDGRETMRKSAALTSDGSIEVHTIASGGETVERLDRSFVDSARIRIARLLGSRTLASRPAGERG